MLCLRSHAAAALLGVVLLSMPIFAQQTTGTIRGVVTDPTGASIPRVKISATNDQTRVTQTTNTGENGSYVFPLLPPGSYTLTADNAGFSKAVRANVLVRITETEVVDFSMQLGSVSETISVEENVSLLQTESSAEGRVIERQTISSLPLATRNFTQLLGLTAELSLIRPTLNRWGLAHKIQASTDRGGAAITICLTGM